MNRWPQQFTKHYAPDVWLRLHSSPWKQMFTFQFRNGYALATTVQKYDTQPLDDPVRIDCIVKVHFEVDPMFHQE